MNELHKKQIAQAMQNPLVLLAMGFVFAGMNFLVFLWGTDSGSILAYAIFMVGIYATIRCVYRSIILITKTIKRN